MGSRRVLVLVAVSGCSYAFPRAPVTAASQRSSCTSSRAVADTAIGAGLIGTGVGVGAIVPFFGAAEDSTLPMVAGTALAVAGVVYLVSAHHGFRERQVCEAEVVALEHQAEPMHAEPPKVALTCEQRRLDMYSRAVTGADEVQRKRLLLALPACGEPVVRERAWALTRMASLDALAGRCDGIEQIAREVFDLDVVLHDVVLMGDIEVKHCLQLRKIEL